MQNKKLMLATGILFAVTFSTTLSAETKTQTITPEVDSFEVLAGDTFEFPLVYTSDDETMTGVSVILSFDSKKLNFLGFSDKLQTGFLAADKKSKLASKARLKKVSTNNTSSKNSAIAKMAWVSIDGSWPGEGQLPARLGVAHFKVLDLADSVTQIEISGDAAAQSKVVAKPVKVTIGQGTEVAAVTEVGTNNISAGSGSGGSMSWLFLPFLLLLSVLKRFTNIRRVK